MGNGSTWGNFKDILEVKIKYIQMKYLSDNIKSYFTG